MEWQHFTPGRVSFDPLVGIYPGCLPVTHYIVVGLKWLVAQYQDGNTMILNFIPFALLRNSLNCERKYLDNKISSVEIVGQLGPDRVMDKDKERATDHCRVVCELSYYEIVIGQLSLQKIHD